MNHFFITRSNKLTEQTVHRNFQQAMLLQQLECVGRLSPIPEPERRMHSEENIGNYLRRSDKGRLKWLSYSQPAKPLKPAWLSFRTDRTHGKTGHYWTSGLKLLIQSANGRTGFVSFVTYRLHAKRYFSGETHLNKERYK